MRGRPSLVRCRRPSRVRVQAWLTRARPDSSGHSMLNYFRDNFAQIMDGLLFGLGILAVYVGAILSGALVRSLSGAGSSGITFAGRYVRGWWDYLRGDD